MRKMLKQTQQQMNSSPHVDPQRKILKFIPCNIAVPSASFSEKLWNFFRTKYVLLHLSLFENATRKGARTKSGVKGSLTRMKPLVKSSNTEKQKSIFTNAFSAV